MLELTGGILSPAAASGTYGWSFTASQALTVVALDAFGPSPAGDDVRLYDGSLSGLASAVVTTSDPQSGTPTPFFHHAITPVTLTSGSQYYIVEDGAVGLTQLIYSATAALSPLVTFDGLVFDAATGQKPTTNGGNGAFNDGYFGADFDVSGTPPPAPEPSTIAWHGVLAGSGLVARRRRIKSHR